ncbi:MAG: hypothetical protein WC875_01055 [Candidatus Absconditabacterales bacterium]|jgi:hypothetical protein
MLMVSQPIVSYKFNDVPVEVQEQIKTLVQKNIDGKLDSYLKKIYKNKSSAIVRIDYKITCDKKKKYTGDFLFDFDGKNFIYENKVAFKFPEDVINHAFKHFKEFLSKQEK